jgi:hypothetical protein
MSNPQTQPKKIYISGKISDMPYDVAFEKFERAENQLKAIGFEVINPMKLDHKNAVTWSDYMRTDIKALMDCDNIHMLSNWRSSEGAKLEKYIANELDIKEYSSVNIFIEHLKRSLLKYINYRKQATYN